MLFKSKWDSSISSEGFDFFFFLNLLFDYHRGYQHIYALSSFDQESCMKMQAYYDLLRRKFSDRKKKMKYSRRVINLSFLQ